MESNATRSVFSITGMEIERSAPHVQLSPLL